jgi:pimeloyl-ACP methyl ester carboxylesterase
MSTILPLATDREAEGPTLVIALHCSGGSGRQWRSLVDVLEGAAAVVAPDLIGTADVGPWCGKGRFSLADEAAPIVALIDSFTGPVHLVGHSYGAGVALQAAVLRPSRISSLSLYEPTTFSFLSGMGPEGQSALREIQAVARAAQEGLLSGCYRSATECFVDYWNGAGTWAGMKPSVQAELLRYLPKVCLDFQALFTNGVRLEAYRRLQMPILILQGEHAPRPTALIAGRLHAMGHRTSSQLVRGAGHMGPLTHAVEVAELMGRHIRAAQPSSAEPACLCANPG